MGIGVVVFIHLKSRSAYQDEPKNYEKTYPPLIETVFKDDIVTLKKMLEEGADPNIRAFDGSVALHFVCRNGNNTNGLAMLYSLLDYGAFVDFEDSHGVRPIVNTTQITDYKKRMEFISALVKNGADINARTRPIDSGTSTIQVEWTQREFTFLEFMVQNFDRLGVVDLLNTWGLLMSEETRKRGYQYAYDIGFRDIAEEIDQYNRQLAKDPPLKELNITPLMFALLQKNRTDIDRYVKSSGINQKSTDRFERTALHIAVVLRDLTSVKSVIGAKATITERDYVGNSALHLIMGPGYGGDTLQKEIVRLLFAENAQLTEKNKRGDTPLHRAIRLRDSTMVQFLVDNYYDAVNSIYSTSNQAGFTPVTLAEKLRLEEATKLLRNIRR